MDFRIRALPAERFAPLFGMAAANLAARGVLRVTADREPGFPCRVSLRDAAPGESLLLLNYEHMALPSPYRSRHAIYVREHAIEYRPGVNEVPPVLARRLLSARAFDAEGMLLDAEVCEGTGVAPLIGRYLDDPRVSFVHLHNARPGCYAAQAVRA
ncbi:MAG TPA: DUF1203 domain-containing protein [Steroidobacteraceae bacterium]|nr:DUF1203 domain-containing protein [Steroidobacteraceae bacterium]